MSDICSKALSLLLIDGVHFVILLGNIIKIVDLTLALS